MRPLHQPLQLGDVDGDVPCFVFGHQIRRRTSARLILEVDVSERVAVVILTMKQAEFASIDGPRRREAARGWLIAQNTRLDFG